MSKVNRSRGRERGGRWAALAAAASMAASVAACGGGDTDTTGTTTTTGNHLKTATLTISLSRGAENVVLATIHAESDTGETVTGASVHVSVQGGTAGEVTEKGNGDYAVEIVPGAPDLEIPIDAESDGVHAAKTALALSNVGDDWDQAEAISGLVNTPGWEDGASVSADGEWLIVGSYVPIDILTCALGVGGKDPLSPDTPACNVVLGPYTAPERPDMLGAERILSKAEIQHACPDLNFPPGGGEAPFAVPPVAAYGFHRQADGSYGEPFVIGFAADGCLGPYGFSFVGPPEGTSAALVFANDDPLTSGPGDTKVDLYWTPVTLGQKNILATYAWDGSKVNVTGALPVRLPLPDLAGTQGNVNFSGGRLWWDDESVVGEERQLYVADVTGNLPQATISAAKLVGANRDGLEDIQPTLDGATLYWMGAGLILTADLADGADPGDPASWNAALPILGPAGVPASTIVAVGEPTIAHDGADTWLYFVYIQKNDTGYDANVGRIRKRK